MQHELYSEPVTVCKDPQCPCEFSCDRREYLEYEESKNPGIVSIQKICDGLEISVRKFFDDPLFENLEPEIK